jgi:hypothetical protein
MSDAHALAELGVVTVAAPCESDWSAMRGDDRVRHCALCNLNVYNVEALTSFEVRDLMLRTEGRLCMRLFQRQDGTLITRDCPLGIAETWRQQTLRAKLLSPRVLVWSFIALFGTAQLVFSQWGDEIFARLNRRECSAPQVTNEQVTHTMGLIIKPARK